MTQGGVSPPRAVILAAGRGKRLGATHDGPKAMLRFGGRSLMQRHLDGLRACGVADITVVTGYEEARLRDHVASFDAAVRFVGNPHFTEGSLVSLDCAYEVLVSGQPVVLMDADVIYERDILARLLRREDAACVALVDRAFEPGDEPVKLCIRDGRIVDFAKRPTVAHDWQGESVGFFRFSPAGARALAQAARRTVQAGRRELEYEPVIRDLMVERGAEWSGVEDITGLAWTEIDFPADVERAQRLLDRVDAEEMNA